MYVLFHLKVLEIVMGIKGYACTICKFVKEMVQLTGNQNTLQESKGNTLVEPGVLSRFESLLNRNLTFIYLDKYCRKSLMT